MRDKKKRIKIEKSKLHVNNRFRNGYDFQKLAEFVPELTGFLIEKSDGKESIDFFNPTAVMALNKALLLSQYKLKYWQIPPGYLCPPIPGRADYIHYLADLLKETKGDDQWGSTRIRCLDIGTGANCIYPLLGAYEYGWFFVATDADEIAMKSAYDIVAKNPLLKEKVELRFQKNHKHVFEGIIGKKDYYEFTMCNPPFHSSQEKANAGSLRKLKSLGKTEVQEPILNFGGQRGELWYKGGEIRFLQIMIEESKEFRKNCMWFTSLVSKESNLKPIYTMFEILGVQRHKIIPMGQGNKVSRIIAWSFLSEEDMKSW